MGEFGSCGHDDESCIERGIWVSAENAQFFVDVRILELFE